jgi:hypothetical protein
MAKYDKEFKLKCIKAYEEVKPLPEVDGVLARSLKRYVLGWRLLYKKMVNNPIINKESLKTI